MNQSRVKAHDGGAVGVQHSIHKVVGLPHRHVLRVPPHGPAVHVSYLFLPFSSMPPCFGIHCTSCERNPTASSTAPYPHATGKTKRPDPDPALCHPRNGCTRLHPLPRRLLTRQQSERQRPRRRNPNGVQVLVHNKQALI